MSQAQALIIIMVGIVLGMTVGTFAGIGLGMWLFSAYPIVLAVLTLAGCFGGMWYGSKVAEKFLPGK